MVFSTILGLGLRHTKKRHSRHSRKSKKHRGALTKEEIETIREYTTKTRYFILGDWWSHIDARVVLITPTQITMYDKNGDFYSIGKGKKKYYPPISEQLKDGEWKQQTYKYEKLYMLNHNDTWYNEKEYMKPVNANKDYKSLGVNYDLFTSYEFKYILIKLDSKRYVSLGYIPFEFEIPDDDEIVDLSAIRTLRNDTQNITLFGRRNTYFIDDYNEEIDLNSYISNENIKKYLPQFITPDGQIDRNISLDYIVGDYDISHYASDKGEGKGKGPYLILKDKYKKVLGVIPHWKEKRIYDVIHYLDTKEIKLN